jgi:putative selenate reductase
VLGENLECSLAGVYVIGDCKAGPATVVQAMADAKLAAADILCKEGLQPDFGLPAGCGSLAGSLAGSMPATQGAAAACKCEAGSKPDSQGAAPAASSVGREQLLSRKGRLLPAERNAAAEAARCLGCGEVCQICVDVCPNRANVAVSLEPDVSTACGFAQATQILHIDRLCNECGNCAVFCPSGGKPYLEKLTIFFSEEDMSESSNAGWLSLGNGERKHSGSLDALTIARVGSIAKAVAADYPYLADTDDKQA